MNASSRATIYVSARTRSSTEGRVRFGTWSAPCALGRGGRGYAKKEGDGITPIGFWLIEQVYFRADRRPFSDVRAARLSMPMRRADGWCDAVGDRNYNRKVCHPYPASAEQLWRDDHLYDVVGVLSHNRRPRIQGAGSAIFLHVAERDERGYLKPTAGCVALERRDLTVLLRAVRPFARVGLRVLG